jgi:hypothetical protein
MWRSYIWLDLLAKDYYLSSGAVVLNLQSEARVAESTMYTYLHAGKIPSVQSNASFGCAWQPGAFSVGLCSRLCEDGRIPMYVPYLDIM